MFYDKGVFLLMPLATLYVEMSVGQNCLNKKTYLSI